MRWRTRLVGGLVLAAMAAASAWADGAIPVGSAEAVADLGGTALTVFTYKPEGCTPRATCWCSTAWARNADSYRDHARPLAQSLCLLVVAPSVRPGPLPALALPGGRRDPARTAQPPQSWTGTLAIELVDWVRQREAAPSCPMTCSAIRRVPSSSTASPPSCRTMRIASSSPTRPLYVRARLDLAAPSALPASIPATRRAPR